MEEPIVTGMATIIGDIWSVVTTASLEGYLMVGSVIGLATTMVLKLVKSGR